MSKICQHFWRNKGVNRPRSYRMVITAQFNSSRPCHKNVDSWQQTIHNHSHPDTLLTLELRFKAKNIRILTKTLTKNLQGSLHFNSCSGNHCNQLPKWMVVIVKDDCRRGEAGKENKTAQGGRGGTTQTGNKTSWQCHWVAGRPNQ